MLFIELLIYFFDLFGDNDNINGFKRIFRKVVRNFFG